VIVPDRSLTYPSGGDPFLPSQPAWFVRLDEILEILQASPLSHLDRQAVETLFGVGQRRARQLMAGLPCLQVGNAVAVCRLALINRLQNTARSDRFQWEISRRTRMAASLDSLQKETAARRFQISVAPDSWDRLVPELSPSIEFRPGELLVRFANAEDLAAKLFELSQAMANDWHAFQEALEDQSRGRAASI
jgi:hypothetical protein